MAYMLGHESSREVTPPALSNWNMNGNAPLKKPEFSLSQSARKYLDSFLPRFASDMQRRGIVTALTYSGGAAVERDGKILWQYRGPNFLIAGIQFDDLRPGNFYDIFGQKVWVGEMEEALLEGMTLTTIVYGSPEPDELS